MTTVNQAIEWSVAALQKQQADLQAAHDTAMAALQAKIDSIRGSVTATIGGLGDLDVSEVQANFQFFVNSFTDAQATFPSGAPTGAPADPAPADPAATAGAQPDAQQAVAASSITTGA